MTRVLIVDDNVENLYLLRVLLEADGFVVGEARHGGEALQSARQSAPDLVVSDLLMPVLDGYALLRQWKSDPQLAGIPFVVYTATYVEPEDKRLALAMGADAFLIKPAEPAESLLTCLKEVLARSRHGKAPSAVMPAVTDQDLLAQYNEVLVRKLEKRALQLEQNHRELQESEERFRATFEQAAVGIAHVGIDARFLRVNDKLCAITGYSRDELLTLDFWSLTVPEDLDSVQARRALAAGILSHHTAEKRCRRKDGSMVWISLVATLLRSAAGEPRYFISVFTDISERKALEGRVQQAQKLESVGQLTGGIAHDFNNLLTVIIGNADMLVQELADDERLRPLAEMTRTAATRGADLIQRLLAFARRQALEPRVVDVNELLLDMERMLKRMLPESIDISLVRGEGQLHAIVDPAQLDAAVLNLGINARDAMPSGGRLSIETSHVDIDDDRGSLQADLSPGAYVVVAVSDTGTGIAPEHLTRVFDPFFTTKPVGKNTGLGLSMVYGFAKQSRGHVRIYSELGQGTTVRLYLPRAIGQELDVATDTEPDAGELHGDECILLVEDDELVRHFAERQLTALGYRVVSAANGADAMSIVRARSDIDLLLTDVVMPGGMDGPQLVDAALALRPGLKVLFSSGYADQALLHGGRLEPGVNLLGKPYGRRELARKVKMALGEQTVTAKVTGPPARPARLLVLDDDLMVAKVLGTAAERLGFQVALTSDAAAFLERAREWAPSHVAIDLVMPGLGGVQVLDRLAEAGCTARVIISSGADAIQINAALDHARAKGLPVAGTLVKPFSMSALRDVLN